MMSEQTPLFRGGTSHYQSTNGDTTAISHTQPSLKQRIGKYVWQRLPFLTWVPKYNVRENLRGDIAAGLTVGIMTVPQAMAYSTVAGLHPVYGLYCAFIPPLIYFFFGTSPHLIVGPTAVLSLLTGQAAASLGYKASVNDTGYLNRVLLVSFLSGIMEFLFGIFRAGFLANFISYPLISGFTHASAVLIGLGQLKNWLAININDNESRVYILLQQIIEQLRHANVWSFLIGLGALVVMTAIKLIPGPTRRLPGPLLAVIGGTLLCWGLRLDRSAAVAIVGDIPQGLSAPTSVKFDDFAWPMLPASLFIALLGFLEALSIGSTFAVRYRYDIDANQELLGLGLANVVGSFFRAYPATGSFSRTAVNAASDARTGFSNVVSALVVLVSIEALTPLFFYLPKAVLAAVVIMAVPNLIDVHHVVLLWRCKKRDFVVWVVTFVSVLCIGVQLGVGIGIVVSMFLVLLSSARPKLRVVPADPSWSTSTGLAVGSLEHALVVQVYVDLLYTNAGSIRQQIRSMTARFIEEQRATTELPEDPGGIRQLRLVVDLAGTNDVDSTAVSMLMALGEEFVSLGVTLCFANVKPGVRTVMERAKLLEKFITLYGIETSDLDAGTKAIFFNSAHTLASQDASIA